jgi:hypothetical protein
MCCNCTYVECRKCGLKLVVDLLYCVPSLDSFPLVSLQRKVCTGHTATFRVSARRRNLCSNQMKHNNNPEPCQKNKPDEHGTIRRVPGQASSKSQTQILGKCAGVPKTNRGAGSKMFRHFLRSISPK